MMPVYFCSLSTTEQTLKLFTPVNKLFLATFKHPVITALLIAPSSPGVVFNKSKKPFIKATIFSWQSATKSGLFLYRTLFTLSRYEAAASGTSYSSIKRMARLPYSLYKSLDKVLKASFTVC